MPTDAERVLARWREVERDLVAAEPGSPAAERLQEEAARLRDEYQQLMADVEGHAREVRELDKGHWPSAAEQHPDGRLPEELE